ncbi:MAG: ABC-F family ATP-binding cassette domain-containing protein [Anaerolineales bacterium]|nr:ABC-F family ATP-binding cassette domain-containing protein [Chloroflexota bacterium]MBL6981496.1 ABC-F family ATP-binding cassette domain-containing protein [Anaerolineales bacterium]
MSLIATHNLGKSFDPVDIFAGFSLSISHGARVALVGPNGIGKTTFLRIIAGRETPSEGEVHRARGLTMGYLPQESVLESDRTLWEECLLPFAALRSREAELARLEAQMSEPNAGDEILERYGELQEKFEHAGGYSYETRIRQVLTGLGFADEEFNMPLEHLSGGQRTRALLARLLLEAPTLLILDEPTNHLDIQAVEWLENYLKDWDGAALIVSHDRYFLDKACNHIWEMSKAGCETYRGNYTHYLQQRQERWERRSKTFEAEKLRLEKEFDYIKRNIAGQNVSSAKGRLKRLSRQLQAIEQIGLDAMQGKTWSKISEDVITTKSIMNVDQAHASIKALRNPLQRPEQLKLNLSAQKRSGELVLRTYDLEIGYPGNSLFKSPDIILRRLECAALIGPNGAGKTTFLKTILGQLSPLSGEVDLGASLDVGYFAQAHEELNPEKTLVEEIEAMSNMYVAEIRSYLARYLFTREDVFKKVAVLSGGERGRLALAKLALGDANFLLLDEPTNHLDIPAQEVLQAVLDEFKGTTILVSHDRYLIDALGTQIWEIDKEGTSLNVFRGTYSEYRLNKDKLDAADSLDAGSMSTEGDSYRDARSAKNRQQAELRRRQRRVEEIEKRVEELEMQMAEISHQLENPPEDSADVQRLGDDYVEIQNEMHALIAEWEQLQT